MSSFDLNTVALDTLSQYVGRVVTTQTVAGVDMIGTLFTIDPETRTMVLLQYEGGDVESSTSEDAPRLLQPVVVWPHGCGEVSVISEEDSKTCAKYPNQDDISAFISRIGAGTESNDGIGNDSCEKQPLSAAVRDTQAEVMAALLENRCPFSLEPDGVITVFDQLTIHPPYRRRNIQCGNEIILARVSQLVPE